MRGSDFCELYLVRHGETVFNKQKRLQGHMDSPLTPEGVAQVEKLKERFYGIHFDAVFSSDLLRAQRTAEIVALERSLAVTTSHLLRERSFGEHEGKQAAELEASFKDLWEWYERLSYEERFKIKLSPQIESEEEAITRYLTFLREIAVSHLNKRVLVVSHGAIMRILLLHLGFAPQNCSLRITIPNCAHIVLYSDGSVFTVSKTYGITISPESPA